MLQRIQTIWLILASVAILLLFVFPSLQLAAADGSARVIKITGVHDTLNGQTVKTQEFMPLTISCAVVALLPLLTIFSFRNRKRQIMLGYLCIVAILAFGFWAAQTAQKVKGNITAGMENFGIGALLPSIAIVFVLLAIRGIRKDEKLIRSADRLR